MFIMNVMAELNAGPGMGGGTSQATGGAAEQAVAGGGWMSFLPLILIFVIFYFVLILPQKKQEKKQRSMIDALVPGDEIVTIGGIYGNVVSVKDDAIVIESSADKTKIKIAKSSVSKCLTVKEEEKKK